MSDVIKSVPKSIEEAHESYITQTVDMDPAETQEWLESLEYILSTKGEYDQALQHMDWAVRIHPRHPQGWFNRATISPGYSCRPSMAWGRSSATAMFWFWRRRSFPNPKDAIWI